MYMYAIMSVGCCFFDKIAENMQIYKNGGFSKWEKNQ